MIQFGRFNFLDLINPAVAVNNINKTQNLARTVSDNKINIAAHLFKTFKKILLEGSGITTR